MQIKILSLLSILLLFSVNASAADIGIYIDGTEIETDVSPIIENDRTMVPIRGVFEHIGAEIGWNNGIVTITAPKKNITITIGENSLFFNGEKKSLDTPAKIKSNRTYIPLRAISSLMDCDVEWDGKNKNVYLYKDTLPPISEQYNFLFEYEVFTLVNEIRTQNGLEKLLWSPELSRAGRRHAEDMSLRNFFNHINLDNQSPFDRMRSYEITYMYAAENIANAYDSPQEAIDGWMNSDSHRENILNPEFKKIGVGFYKNYWCQEFTD